MNRENRGNLGQKKGVTSLGGGCSDRKHGIGTDNDMNDLKVRGKKGEGVRKLFSRSKSRRQTPKKNELEKINEGEKKGGRLPRSKNRVALWVVGFGSEHLYSVGEGKNFKSQEINGYRKEKTR